MVDNPVVIVPEMEGTPRFNAAWWQLNRQEALIDKAMNNYLMLHLAVGREIFITAIEMLYITLSSHLDETSRINIKKNIDRVRNQVDDMNAGGYGDIAGAFNTNSNITSLKREGKAILELLFNLKDKKAKLGIPMDMPVSPKEQLESALDIEETAKSGGIDGNSTT